MAVTAATQLRALRTEAYEAAIGGGASAGLGRLGGGGINGGGE